MVIGGCLTADYDGKLGHYLNLLNTSGALAMCDALSFHPYSSRLDSSSYSAMANISMLKQKTGGKTLWNSELYYLWDPPRKFFSKEQVLFTGMKPHHLFRRFCIDFGEGVMQSMPLSSEHLVMGDGDSKWEGRATFLGFHMIPAPMYAVYASSVFPTPSFFQQTVNSPPSRWRKWYAVTPAGVFSLPIGVQPVKRAEPDA